MKRPARTADPLTLFAGTGLDETARASVERGPQLGHLGCRTGRPANGEEGTGLAGTTGQIQVTWDI
jgi:hypothetical protein